jgi:hypothetical protein
MEYIYYKGEYIIDNFVYRRQLLEKDDYSKWQCLLTIESLALFRELLVCVHELGGEVVLMLYRCLWASHDSTDWRYSSLLWLWRYSSLLLCLCLILEVIS